MDLWINHSRLTFRKSVVQQKSKKKITLCQMLWSIESSVDVGTFQFFIQISCEQINLQLFATSIIDFAILSLETWRIKFNFEQITWITELAPESNDRLVISSYGWLVTRRYTFLRLIWIKWNCFGNVSVCNQIRRIVKWHTDMESRIIYLNYG